MTREEMGAIIKATKPGDELRLVFVNKTFNGDLKGRLYHILCMCSPIGNAISMAELSMLNLQAVADSGRWEGFRTYIVTILEGFDAEHFARRTIEHEMLESINLEEQ